MNTQTLLKTLLPTAALALLPVDLPARTSFGVSVDLGGVAWSVHRSRHHTVAHVAVMPAVAAPVAVHQTVVQHPSTVYLPAVVPQRTVVVQPQPPVVYHQPQPVVYHLPPVVYHQPSVVYHHPPVIYHRQPVWRCPRTRYVPRRSVCHRPVAHAPSHRRGRR